MMDERRPRSGRRRIGDAAAATRPRSGLHGKGGNEPCRIFVVGRKDRGGRDASKGTMEAAERGRRGRAAHAARISSPSKVKIKAKDALELHLKLPARRRRHDEGPGHLHPPVRHHDRRRPAAGAVPGHPRRSQSDNRSFQDILPSVKDTVEGGSTFADALRKHPKVFDELYVQHGRGRRGGRHPRHHPEPARRLHRKDHEA